MRPAWKLKNRCGAKQRSGEPCWMPALLGSTYCFVHDTSPDVVARRRRGQKRGGKNRRRCLTDDNEPTGLDSVEGIRDLMVRTIASIRAGKLDIRSGVALAFACRTAPRAMALADDKPGARDAMCSWPIDLEILALKELARVGKNGSLRHDSFLRELYQQAVDCFGPARCDC